MPLEVRRHVGRDVFRLHRLVEAQHDDRRAIVSAAGTIPVRLEQPRRRRRERESIRTLETTAAVGRGGRVDRHVVLRRQRQLARRREDQDRRAGPAEGPGNRGRDVEERRTRLRRHSAERHHRLGEDNANFVGLLDGRHFARRPGADDAQWGPRWRCGLGIDGGSGEQEERGGKNGAMRHRSPSNKGSKD